MKYELGQLVWYMHNNKVFYSKVISRIMVEHLIQGDASISPSQYQTDEFGYARVQYLTSHGAYSEDSLFLSKEDLIASL